tara:strand:+ start:138 stop:821 length:684 start_codon:yes stop_codon:yes gene_type:complete
MLAQRLGLSINSTRPLGKWSPDDEATLVAWYQNKVGITLNGSDVSHWTDSSSNSYDMIQTDEVTEQPAYNASTGALTFVNADTNNLQSSSEINLSGAFTIGIKMTPTSFSNVVIASNTKDNEFIKITANNKIRIKTDAAVGDFTLDSGTFGDDYIVFTRDGSNLVTLWKNGVAQADTETRSGTVDIDCIGVRKTDTNAYAGTIKEIQIYSSTSTDLTANINDRLSTL